MTSLGLPPAASAAGVPSGTTEGATTTLSGAPGQFAAILTPLILPAVDGRVSVDFETGQDQLPAPLGEGENDLRPKETPADPMVLAWTGLMPGDPALRLSAPAAINSEGSTETTAGPPAEAKVGSGGPSAESPAEKALADTPPVPVSGPPDEAPPEGSARPSIVSAGLRLPPGLKLEKKTSASAEATPKNVPVEKAAPPRPAPAVEAPPAFPVPPHSSTLLPIRNKEPGSTARRTEAPFPEPAVAPLPPAGTETFSLESSIRRENPDREERAPNEKAASGVVFRFESDSLGAAPTGSAAARPETTAFPGETTGTAASPPVEWRSLVQRLDWHWRGGKGDVTIALHPRDLGRVSVRMETVNDVVSVRFEVDNEAARAGLAHRSDELTQSLRDLGWRVDNVHVSLAGAGTDAFSRNGQSSSDGSRSPFRWPSAARGTIPALPEARGGPSPHLVDLVA
ncbi:MAG TPA: flagellar hook-length control protein FliK [Elusimicrobiota bacterium]|nr:flagellar hook-length control protein FliK [Elusimicrobiota bacterium]